MNTAAVIGCLVTLVALAIPAGTAEAVRPSATPSAPCGCSWTVDQLPRTPDAVEGWYEGC
jgi:hypothetical protein